MENRVLGRSIAILHRREQKYMIQKMKEYGIGYSSYNFLFYLSAYPGSSQKEMCENMAVDEALAVRTMKKLQEQGLIQRKKRSRKWAVLCYQSYPKGRGVDSPIKKCSGRVVVPGTVCAAKGGAAEYGREN